MGSYRITSWDLGEFPAYDRNLEIYGRLGDFDRKIDGAIFLGSWAAFIFSSYRVAMLHLVFLGGYSLMTFTVATMVITSHAGKSEQLRRPSIVYSFPRGTFSYWGRHLCFGSLEARSG